MLREPDCEWCQDSGLTASGGFNEIPRTCEFCERGELERRRHCRYNIVAVTILGLLFCILWWLQWGNDLAR
jgi:hypothetical protein